LESLDLLTQVSAAISAFYNATVNLDFDSVTQLLFQTLDGRCSPEAPGQSRVGSHYMIAGGAVKAVTFMARSRNWSSQGPTMPIQGRLNTDDVRIAIWPERLRSGRRNGPGIGYSFPNLE